MADNNKSILNSTKLLMGIMPSVTAFDTPLIFHINTCFTILYQLGVGSEPFIITGANDTWDDFTSEIDLELVKSYVYMKARMMFDPPTGSVADSMKNMISELEWRINIAVDPGKEA